MKSLLILFLMMLHVWASIERNKYEVADVLHQQLQTPARIQITHENGKKEFINTADCYVFNNGKTGKCTYTGQNKRMYNITLNAFNTQSTGTANEIKVENNSTGLSAYFLPVSRNQQIFFPVNQENNPTEITSIILYYDYPKFKLPTKMEFNFKSNNVPEIIDTKSYNLLPDGYTATYNIKGPEKNSYYTIYLNAFDDTHKYTFMVHILKNGREKILMNEGKSFMYKDSMREQYQTFQSKIGTLELTYDKFELGLGLRWNRKEITISGRVEIPVSEDTGGKKMVTIQLKTKGEAPKDMIVETTQVQLDDMYAFAITNLENYILTAKLRGFICTPNKDNEHSTPQNAIINFTCRKSTPTICSICQEMIEDDDLDNLTQLECDHCFHYSCIRPWVDGKRKEKCTCPYCRKLIDQTQLENEYQNRLLESK